MKWKGYSTKESSWEPIGKKTCLFKDIKNSCKSLKKFSFFSPTENIYCHDKIDAFEKKTLDSLAARNINLSEETTANLEKTSNVICNDENNDPQNEDYLDDIKGKSSL